MGSLSFRRRRKPLGQLPVARFGTRPGAIGLLAEVDDSFLASAEAIAPSETDEYVTKVASRHGIGWGIRIRGLLPEAVRDSEFIQQFLVLEHSASEGVSEGHNPLLDKPLSSLLEQRKYLAIPKEISSDRNYLSVSTYDRDVLPLDSLLVIDADSGATFGWLSSNAFWLWTQVVASNAPTATTYTAYNSFPAPALSRKNKELLDSAANTVLRSRGHFLETTLTELYDGAPEQLLWAHQELDALVNQFFGLARDASDSDVINALIESYQLLVAA